MIELIVASCVQYDTDPQHWYSQCSGIRTCYNRCGCRDYRYASGATAMGVSEQVTALFTIIVSLAVVLVIVAVGWWLIWKACTGSQPPSPPPDKVLRTPR